MNIPEEIVNRMAEEIYKELEEESKQSGKKITFDTDFHSAFKRHN